jgi:hypothetical protein
MNTFQKCEQLKIERRTAIPDRQGQIDQMVKRLEPFLAHDEAVSIVQQYESGLRRLSTKVDGVPLWQIEPWEKQAQEWPCLGAGSTIPLYRDEEERRSYDVG